MKKSIFKDTFNNSWNKTHSTTGDLKRAFLFCAFLSFMFFHGLAQDQRKDILLNNDWHTIASDSNNTVSADILSASQFPGYSSWQRVNVPHTWDKYGGYRQLNHGNRHGYAWYRNAINVKKEYAGKRLFLWFEGVSSFAIVWVNGRQVGTHAGGRTSFTLDITTAVKPGTNIVVVKADHPSYIRTLPWVCGGCSEEQGFSEGSQPMGIFRPVHLMVTAPVRIEPFGVHIWNDDEITARSAMLHTATEVKNYTQHNQVLTVTTRIINPYGRLACSFVEKCTLTPGQTNILKHTTPAIVNPFLWSLENPVLYKAVTQVVQDGRIIDETSTTFGIRWIKWDIKTGTDDARLLLNGKPVYLNGTSEYEHLLGNSHAFTATEIKARAMQVRAAGFNAFRDAHQPHNLRYQHYWDSLGIAWWPQFAAHIWFDLPEFRNNFKTLLRDWVKERRNSPSVILWGLENESSLPEDFARECSAIIRELDPTASSQRKITTCNGGTGTDWNVPQNWTGTYGGNPFEYGSDLIKQGLVGEYGGWRVIDWHTEGPFNQKGPLSETHHTELMEMKVRLADSVKERTAGHFHWLLYSHDNPGRFQPDEGYRYIDKVGPVNNKGLFTIWGEPTDAFYMFRANYASPVTDPMLYIVSHTWPERFVIPGSKPAITIYSNCEEVELFNDCEGFHSMGRKKKGGIGTHFEWKGTDVKYNVLYARGYIKGKVVAEDKIVLNGLSRAPHFNSLFSGAHNITMPIPGHKYLYRVNCGGGDYTDINGNMWQADVPFSDSTTAGSVSWSAAFTGLSPVVASQRRTFDVIKGTKDWPLFQQYRYGREELKYYFPLSDGDYMIELYFIEPWYGIGGGMDCTQWRTFDVAVNGKTVLRDLDIWKEAGSNTALRKKVKARIKGGHLVISFPSVQSGEAIISAIAISAENNTPSKISVPSGGASDLLHPLFPAGWSVQHWLGKGNLQYAGSDTRINILPPLLYGDTWIRTSASMPSAQGKTTGSFSLKKAAVIYIAVDDHIKQIPAWLKTYTADHDSLVSDANGGTLFRLYRKTVPADSLLLLGENGVTAEGDAQPYSVIIHYPTAYEKSENTEKPVTDYLGEDAVLHTALLDNKVKGFTGKGYALIRNAADTVSWKITVDEESVYELRFRYRTANGNQIPAWLTVTAPDGTLIKKHKMFFAGAATKWKTMNSSTDKIIGPGEYVISIIPSVTEELYLDRLEVE